jgi:hypothetical protein
MTAILRRGYAAVLMVVVYGTLAVLVAFGAYMMVKSACHECLALPVVAQCERSNDAVSVRVESNRAPVGEIKRREFAGCVFYWHEDPRPRDTPWWRDD